MNYEIDFVGVPSLKKDSDAICFRYQPKKDGRYMVCIYDCGYHPQAEEMIQLLDKYYLSDNETRIDYVFCSHPDRDHVSALKEIVKYYSNKIGFLVMNRPWNSVALNESYADVKTLEDIANEYCIKILDGNTEFHNDYLKILSPTRDFYQKLIHESHDNFIKDMVNLQESARKVDNRTMHPENWDNETLRDDVSTSAENETSIVLYGAMGDAPFLLTGDAGVRALEVALHYAKSQGIDLQGVQFFQIPHHGSRHNVTPEVLNALIGPVIPQQEYSNSRVVAFVSAAKGSDHPYKMVVNAFIRRGIKVYRTNGGVIHYEQGNMPKREGWGPLQNMPFFKKVEDWKKGE